MARFTYRNHNGLAGGFLNQIQGDLVEYLVEYSAKNVPWNELAQAPEGWKLVRIDGETASRGHGGRLPDAVSKDFGEGSSHTG